MDGGALRSPCGTWLATEAQSVVDEFKTSVASIAISGAPSPDRVEISFVTLEGRPFTVELSDKGFRETGSIGRTSEEEERRKTYFETFKAYLDVVSPASIHKFADDLSAGLRKYEEEQRQATGES
uniref:DUF727 domain-containing protein n=1 Tax=Steinernema glaseri TaxID=37863 RepID=A0A1I7YXC5_9BILA